MQCSYIIRLVIIPLPLLKSARKKLVLYNLVVDFGSLMVVIFGALAMFYLCCFKQPDTEIVTPRPVPFEPLKDYNTSPVWLLTLYHTIIRLV